MNLRLSSLGAEDRTVLPVPSLDTAPAVVSLSISGWLSSWELSDLLVQSLRPSFDSSFACGRFRDRSSVDDDLLMNEQDKYFLALATELPRNTLNR